MYRSVKTPSEIIFKYFYRILEECPTIFFCDLQSCMCGWQGWILLLEIAREFVDDESIHIIWFRRVCAIKINSCFWVSLSRSGGYNICLRVQDVVSECVLAYGSMRVCIQMLMYVCRGFWLVLMFGVLCVSMCMCFTLNMVVPV